MRPRLRAALSATLLLVAACTHHKSRLIPPSSPPASAIPGPTLLTDPVKTCLQRHVPAARWHQAPLSILGADVFVVGFGPANSATIYVEKSGENVISEEEAILQARDKAHGFPSVMRGKGNILVTWASQPQAAQSAVVEECAGFA